MAAALRVGILNDMSEGPPGPTDIEPWLRLPCDELIRNGRIDREIQFIHGWGLGLPSGTAAAVERAYTGLVDQGVLLIVGPAIGDNALVATPLAERHHTPTINWAGSERARSEYMFHLQVGSHEDESIVLARYIASLGVRRVGVVHDRSPIGRRYLSFFQAEIDVIGLRMAATASVAVLTEDATTEVNSVLDSGAEALIYLGLGLSTPAVAQAVKARNWGGTCAMNTAGLRGYAPEFAQIVEGWVYVDMHSDRNVTLRALRGRLGIAPAKGLAAAKGYDLGRLVAEGLARAPELTCKGVKEGLEQIKWLTAAEGHEGTLLGFGNFDRGALHGRYLVLRQWRGGQSLEVTVAQDDTE